MKQGILSILFVILLMGGEFLCYTTLRHSGFPTTSAVVVTLFSCLGLFAMFAGLFIFRPAASFEDDAWERDSQTRSVPRRDPSRSSAARIQAFDEQARLNEFSSEDSLLALDWRPATETAHPEMPLPPPQPEEPPDPVREAMERRFDEFADLMTESARELTRFDLSVLRTLERNAPGSVEGVVTAMKIHAAIEQRLQAIANLLEQPGPIAPGDAQPLLHSDLVTPNDDHLTELFQLDPLPPIAISEVGFHMRVLLKRIARRRSIFRGASQDLLLVGSVRHTLVENPERDDPAAHIHIPWAEGDDPAKDGVERTQADSAPEEQLLAAEQDETPAESFEGETLAADEIAVDAAAIDSPEVALAESSVESETTPAAVGAEPIETTVEAAATDSPDGALEESNTESETTSEATLAPAVDDGAAAAEPVETAVEAVAAGSPEVALEESSTESETTSEATLAPAVDDGAAAAEPVETAVEAAAAGSPEVALEESSTESESNSEATLAPAVDDSAAAAEPVETAVEAAAAGSPEVALEESSTESESNSEATLASPAEDSAAAAEPVETVALAPANSESAETSQQDAAQESVAAVTAEPGESAATAEAATTEAASPEDGAPAAEASATASSESPAEPPKDEEPSPDSATTPDAAHTADASALTAASGDVDKLATETDSPAVPETAPLNGGSDASSEDVTAKADAEKLGEEELSEEEKKRRELKANAAQEDGEQEEKAREGEEDASSAKVPDGNQDAKHS